MQPTRKHLLDAAKKLAPHIHRTQVMTSRQLNDLAGAELYFKCENFQRMGAFKMRGATNALLNLTEVQRESGVVTHSSGNFAQALALAARSTGCKAYIVMPENAPAVKMAATEGYGGVIIESGSSPQAREAKADEVHRETGATFIHPSNDIEVITGNSTAGQELLAEVPDLDIIVVPVGGGGLIAGTALAARHFGKAVDVIGAEPAGADDAFRSLRDGVIYPSVEPETICDGLRTNLGDVNFPIIRENVSEILLVEDADTVRAMRLIWERMKIMVEPSAAITLAAVLGNVEKFNNKKVGLILSGGNVDLSSVWNLFADL